MSRYYKTTENRVFDGVVNLVMILTLLICFLPFVYMAALSFSSSKAIINNHNGKIMGCTLFCADASEIINIVAMAIKTGQNATFLRDFIFTHPSMSEGLNQLFDV